MKKNRFHFVLLIFVHIASFAQPVLDSSNCNPGIGDIFIFKNCNGLTNVGLPGANQTWNLSAFSVTNTNTYACYSTTGSSFPSASVRMNSGSSNIYYTTSSSVLETSGIEDGVGTVYTYSDNEKILNYPFTFGNAFSDSWANSFNNGVQTFRTGTTATTADGYGTLILPGGTYTNILRVKMIQTYTDSVPGLGNVYAYVNTMYNWYKTGNHQPIASVSSLVINGAPPILFGKYLGEIAVPVKDIHENETAGIIVYPNLAVTSFTVMLHTEIPEVTFSLNDIIGQEIPLHIVQKSSTEFVITPTRMNTGIFTLTIFKEGHKIGSRRIVMNAE